MSLVTEFIRSIIELNEILTAILSIASISISAATVAAKVKNCRKRNQAKIEKDSTTEPSKRRQQKQIYNVDATKIYSNPQQLYKKRSKKTT